MRTRRIGQLRVFCVFAAMVGCSAGPRGAAVTVAVPSRAFQTIPPVPEDIAAQRVRYSSPNLLEGDTSFELPNSSYVIEVIDRPGATGSERPARIRRRPVTTLAVHGQKALRLASLTPGCDYVVRWSAVQLSPGQAYAFSAYLRSPTGGVRVRLVCQPASGKSQADGFVPAGSWLRYSSSFAAPGNVDQAESVSAAPSIIVSSTHSGREGAASQDCSIDIDAVQLEAGDAPNPYRPQRAVDYAVIVAGCRGDDPVVPGQPLMLNCVARNNAPVPVRLQLVWQLADVLTRSGPVQSAQIMLPPSRSQDARVSFGSAVPGHYLLTTYVRGGMDLGFSDQRELAVFDPARCGGKGADSFFALAWHGHLDRESQGREPHEPHGQDARATAAASRPWSESEPIFDRITADWPEQVMWRWRDLETFPGVDDLRRADSLIDAMRLKGIEPIVCLCGPAPTQFSEAPDSVGRPALAEGVGWPAPPWAVPSGGGSFPPVGARQYRQFVFRTVAHFAGRIGYWQIPPVPTDKRLQWARLFHQAVKLADPRAQVAGPSPEKNLSGRPSMHQTMEFIAGGGVRDVDVLLHATWAPAQTDPSRAWQELDRSLSGVVQACSAAGRAGLPHWELTAAWPDPNNMDIGARAIQLHRAALLLKKHGTGRWLIPAPPSPEAPGSLGPAVEVTAIATVADWLGESTFRQERRIASGLVGLTFDGPRGAFAALVCTNEGSPAQSVPVSVPSGIRVTNLFGRILTDGAEATTLTLTATPVYLWPTDGRADVLDGIAAPGAAEWLETRGVRS